MEGLVSISLKKKDQTNTLILYRKEMRAIIFENKFYIVGSTFESCVKKESIQNNLLVQVHSYTRIFTET